MPGLLESIPVRLTSVREYARTVLGPHQGASADAASHTEPGRDLVVPKLQAAGHKVFTPVLTGLGNDSPRLSPAVESGQAYRRCRRYWPSKNIRVTRGKVGATQGK